MPKETNTRITKGAATQIEDTGVLMEKPTKDTILNQLGASGTRMTSGIIYDEYNHSLSGTQGMETYNRMRRSDAQVFATLLVCELPIRAVKWYIEPATDESGMTGDAEHEIADFVQSALFEKMDITWDATLIEILTMLPFGFSLFEKVYRVDGDKVILKKLASRKQTSILKWETSKGAPGVTQSLPQPIVTGENKGYTEVDIPAYKLVNFTFRQEGDNYEGVSVLRSAHRNWFYKDKFYQWDAIKHERQSIGIPVFWPAETVTKDEKQEMKTIAANIKANEMTGIVMPGPKTAGWDFEFADLKGNTGSDLWKSIDHHNREIAKNILAQFLELGNTESGSFALGESQQSLFMLSLNALARQIVDVINRYIIPELVDLNFDNVVEYPKITYKKLGAVDLEKLANSVTALTGASLITPDEDLEAFLREAADLPAKMKQEEVADTGPEDGEDPMEDGGTEIDPTGDMPEDGGGVAEMDALTSDLEDLANEGADSEDFSIASLELVERFAMALDTMEGQAFVKKGGHLSEETKKKISEALMKKGGAELQSDKQTVGNRIEQTRNDITDTEDAYRQELKALRGDVDKLKTLRDSIPAGKAGTAKRKEVAKQARALLDKMAGIRKERDGAVQPLKKLRTEDLKTRKAVNEEIRARKKQLSVMIKGIRTEVKAKRMTVKDAVIPLRTQIKDNTENVQELRKAISGLPKDDPQRAALKSMVEGIMSENKEIRGQTQKLRDDFGAQRDATNAQIEQVKQKSGLYHDHDDGYNVLKDQTFMDICGRLDNRFIIQMQNECRTPEDKTALKARGFRFNDYEEESPREMTFAEKKVNFSSLKNSMSKYEEVLKSQLDDITAKQKKDLLDQVKRAVEANDIQAIGKIKVKYGGDLSQALTDIQKTMFETGKQHAANEMSVLVPPTKNEVKGALRVQNDALVAGLVQDMESAAKLAVTQVTAKKGGSITATGAPETVAAVSASVDQIIARNTSTLKTLGVTGAVNLGRSAIFEKYPEKVYGMQYSAILDERTTDTCRSLDGRVVQPGSSDFYDYSPPRHEGCRSIWVEILTTETFKPVYTGIPSTIPANQTVDTYQKMQAPIILKDSPARKVIEQELADRKEKLAALQESGKFPNRQEDHQKRVDELEKALSDADKATPKQKDQAFKEYTRAILAADGITLLS